jgi:hypothetical protein
MSLVSSVSTLVIVLMVIGGYFAFQKHKVDKLKELLASGLWFAGDTSLESLIYGYKFSIVDNANLQIQQVHYETGAVQSDTTDKISVNTFKGTISGSSPSSQMVFENNVLVFRNGNTNNIFISRFDAAGRRVDRIFGIIQVHGNNMNFVEGNSAPQPVTMSIDKTKRQILFQSASGRAASTYEQDAESGTIRFENGARMYLDIVNGKEALVTSTDLNGVEHKVVYTPR